MPDVELTEFLARYGVVFKRGTCNEEDCGQNAMDGEEFCFSHNRAKWFTCDVCGRPEVRYSPCRSCRTWARYCLETVFKLAQWQRIYREIMPLRINVRYHRIGRNQPKCPA